MIVLTVISFNNAPSSGPSASFDELGGTIGRADSNQLVLPDPERTISRIHARVLFRNGTYAIVDNGSNPISVNGRVVGGGLEVPLQPGDQVQVGGYVLSATAGGAATSADPFADLFGDGLALPASAPAAGAMARPAPPAPPRAAPPPAAAAPSSASAIPDDWDPFAPEPSAPAAPAHVPAGGGALSDFVRAAPIEDSLDDLFGLGAGAGPADPLAKAMPMPAGPPNMSAHSDPLIALGRAPAAPPSTEGNLGSELNTPMPLVRATLPPSGAVFSWDEPVGGADTPRRVERAASVTPLPLPRAAAPARAPAEPASPGADALLAALLEGLGSPALRIDDLTPQTMRAIGQLLHEATRGTVELLLARAALKREIRAEVTMIVTRENNPLKFSPTVDVALQHLLGAPTPGFLPGPAAMRDAYDDLRAHQLGVMAGMRAALDGVLQRFDPAQLESNIASRSSIGSLFAVGRKARLWELFQELFSQLQSEAQDNFDELFGKAFLQAYEQHIDRLREPSDSVNRP